MKTPNNIFSRRFFLRSMLGLTVGFIFLGIFAGIRDSFLLLSKRIKALGNTISTRRLLINAGVKPQKSFFMDTSELKIYSGIGHGENATEQATKVALKKLKNSNQTKFSKIFVNFLVGKECPTLYISRAADIVCQLTSNDVDILLSATTNNSYKNKARVTVMTGAFQQT